MARPTVMTPEVIEKLEEAFKWGCTDNEACLHADIAPSTLYQYQEKNPKFTERKASLKENPILLARSTVVNGLKNDTDLALKYLERKKKNEFSTKVENDIRVKELPKPILGGASVHIDDSSSEVIEA